MLKKIFCAIRKKSKDLGLDFHAALKSPYGMSRKKYSAQMGRPPKSPSKKLIERVVVNMTKTEKRLLEKEAQEAEVSLSAFLLQCWREKVR